MRCISWNIGKNYKILEKQLKIIEDTNPEILALQEVTEKTFLEIEKKIKSKFKFIYFSLNSINKKSLLIGPRKLGVLTASNFKLIPRPDDEFDVPWRERILNLDVFTGKDKFIFYNSYIPPGSSNGWIKIETLEGIFKGLNKKKEKPIILCGDFNIPQAEDSKGNIITFAQKIKLKGKPKLKKSFRGGSGSRWDLAEKNLFKNLKSQSIEDGYRRFHGFKKNDYSFEIIRKGKIISRRRFDHFFVSAEIEINNIEYLHNYRLQKLSDHSPIQMDFTI